MPLATATVGTDANKVILAAWPEAKVSAAEKVTIGSLYDQTYDIVAGSLTAYDNYNDLIGLEVNTTANPHTVGAFAPDPAQQREIDRTDLRTLIYGQRDDIDWRWAQEHGVTTEGFKLLFTWLRKLYGVTTVDANLTTANVAIFKADAAVPMWDMLVNRNQGADGLTDANVTNETEYWSPVRQSNGKYNGTQRTGVTLPTKWNEQQFEGLT